MVNQDDSCGIKSSRFARLKDLIIGKSHNPYDSSLYEKLSLIAFFAWVGLGADGLSSCCYGPSEAFAALGSHIYLSIFVALGSAVTILVISASYSQIIELFPHGGGGYVVASKLLTPELGMISGCALMIDYVLTITVSIASGADAIFSFLPMWMLSIKMEFAICILLVLIVLNLRGVKESVLPLVPIFLTFIAAHVFIVIYALFTHAGSSVAITHSIANDIRVSHSQIGLWGMFIILLRSYSMGAGTYTGIEAVSNGMPALREPRVKTAKRTMQYMAFSLTFMVLGLMLAYLFYNVSPQVGKTLNAVLFEKVTTGWGGWGRTLVLVALISEAVLLFVAAQTGFLGGPMVLSSMSLDRWFPTRFAMLSDRFVNQNGVIIMGLAALVVLVATRGSVTFLVVLYSINVFITFSLSQLGMVRHWWSVRSKEKGWKKRIIINGVGLLMTTFILISMVVIKFDEGGWITLLITGALIGISVFIKNHYFKTAKLLRRLNSLVTAVGPIPGTNAEGDVTEIPQPKSEFDANSKTAILLVSGFNGLGLHTLFALIRLFGATFKNIIFVQVGVIDSGNFKGEEEVCRLEQEVNDDIAKYVNYCRSQGFLSDGIALIGTGVADEVDKLMPRIQEQFPNAVFFGGQLVFPEETYITRLLHNYTVFALQRKFYAQGIPFVMLPIRV